MSSTHFPVHDNCGVCVCVRGMGSVDVGNNLASTGDYRPAIESQLVQPSGTHTNLQLLCATGQRPPILIDRLGGRVNRADLPLQALIIRTRQHVSGAVRAGSVCTTHTHHLRRAQLEAELEEASDTALGSEQEAPTCTRSRWLVASVSAADLAAASREISALRLATSRAWLDIRSRLSRSTFS